MVALVRRRISFNFHRKSNESAFAFREELRDLNALFTSSFEAGRRYAGTQSIYFSSSCEN